MMRTKYQSQVMVLGNLRTGEGVPEERLLWEWVDVPTISLFTARLAGTLTLRSLRNLGVLAESRVINVKKGTVVV